MKRNIFLLAVIVLTMALGLSARRASAQIFASDNAGPYTSWAPGTSGGFGFQPWVMTNDTTTSPYAGTFLGNGDGIQSTNGNYWGMYANTASTAASEAFRAFSNSLPVNATFSIKWQNHGIGTSANNAAGFNLRNGDNTNLQTAATFLNDNTLFSFYYIGGGNDNYYVYDGNGVNTVPITFSQGSQGLQVQVTLLPGGTYNLLIENAVTGFILWSTNSQPLVGNQTIDSVATYDFDTDQNQDFNSLEIYDLPPQIENLQPANGTIYAAAGSQLSFAAVSEASTVASNHIQLTLNGVLETGANWTVLNSGTYSNEVILNTPLQGNQVYNGTIVATDANGNSATNNFTFNTWETAPNNIYIEMSDYNYGEGQWINNFTSAQPNQNYGSFDLLGITNYDYFVYNTQPTNNPYRQGDLTGLEPATDVDHNNFASDGFTPYDLDYNYSGQWEDYTRVLSNVTYAVYARMAGFNGGGTMALAHMAASQVLSTSNQPDATIGTFVCPDTGGSQSWTFVPLKDIFSNPVLVNYGGTTNTFRITDLGPSQTYNASYILLVAVTNSSLLRPYISAGYPTPGEGNVNPQQQVSITIANRQTSVTPSSIQLFINSSNVTSGVALSNNAAGTVLTYQLPPTNAFPSGLNTAEVIYSDSQGSITNTWQFTVETYATLPASWALPLTASYSPGFYEQIAKGDDNATNIDFKPNVARAVAQLNGTLTNSITGLPYANEALNGGVYIETNTINYAIDPSFYGIFVTNAFPDLPAGTTNNVAMAADMYVQLSPGLYNFDVYSDDGFQLSAGPTPASTNLILGIANFGRAATDTPFSFFVQTGGLYPMQLIYFKSQEGGGGVELFYTTNGVDSNVLLNDPNTPGSIKAYYLPGAPKLSIKISGGDAVISWSASGYVLQEATSVNGTFSTINGATSPYPVALSSAKQLFFRLAP
jgi:hypothetical protein